VTQGMLFAFFWALRNQFSVFPCVETRMKLRNNLVLIPDVAVFYPSRPVIDRPPETAPLVAIEVLSPDDKMSAVLTKLAEYRDWGVKHVWLVDPRMRRLYTWDGALTDVAALRVPELGVELGPSQVFE